MNVRYLTRYVVLLCLYTGMIFLLGSVAVSAQQLPSALTISFPSSTLDQCLQQITKMTGVGFTYNPSELKQVRTRSMHFRNDPLEYVLRQLLDHSGYTYRQTGSTLVVFAITQQPVARPPSTESPGWQVRGHVADVRGKPLEGITILNRRKRIAAASDQSGAFSIVASAGQELEISSVGFKMVRVPVVRATDSLMVVLEDDAAELSGMVITGYTQKNYRDITGSMQQVTGDEIRNGVTGPDVASMLKGKITGIYISDQNSADPLTSGGQLLVRGTSSIAGIGVDAATSRLVPTISYGPLIVVDGVVSPYSNLKDAVLARDVQDMVFLKDAASTSIYGSRGAAGVIIITTRRGKVGRTVVQLDTRYGWNLPDRGTFRWMNGQELSDKRQAYYTQAWGNDSGSYMGQGYHQLADLLGHVAAAGPQGQPDVDWTKLLNRTGYVSETNATVTGGSDKNKYYLGLGYYKETGTILGNDIDRESFRFNTDNNVGKFFGYGISLNGIFDNGNEPPVSPHLYDYLPWYSPYQSNGALKQRLEYKGINGDAQTLANPLYDAQYNYNKVRRQNFFGSLKLMFHPFPWLTLSSTNSANLLYTKLEEYGDTRTSEGEAVEGYLLTGTSYTQSLMTSNQLTARKAWGAHHVYFLLGQEFQKLYEETLGIDVNHIPSGFYTIDVAQSLGPEYVRYGSDKQNVQGSKSDGAIFSVFSEAGYDYDHRYYVTGSLRSDASSAFGKDRRYGTFYSGGASWLVSNEAFLKKVKPISLLKLRGSYGTNGSQLGNLFLTKTVYQLQSLTYGGQTYSDLVNLGNSDLTWELTKTTNVGIDVGLWNRVLLSVDLYNKRSERLLQNVAMTGAVGVDAQYQNVGAANNKGIEFSLNTRNVEGKDFKWTTNFNISFNKNRIVHLSGDSLLISYYTYSYYLYPGDDLNSIKGVKYAGVDEATGKPLFEKRLLDEKGAVTGTKLVNSASEAWGTGARNSMYTIGTKTPKFNGGFSNTFAYKRVSLTVLAEFVYGTTTYNDYRAGYQNGNLTYNANQVAYTKYQHPWKGVGDKEANEPSVFWAQNSDYNNPLSSAQYDNNSFLRIRNVRLDYNIPMRRLNKLISQANVYVSLDNLYTFTGHHFLGTDPEAPYIGGGQQSLNGMGELAGTPHRIIIGLSVSF